MSGNASYHVFQNHRIEFPTLDAPRTAQTGQQLGTDPSRGSGAAPWSMLRGRKLSAGTPPRDFLLLLVLMKMLPWVSGPTPAQARHFPPSSPGPCSQFLKNIEFDQNEI